METGAALRDKGNWIADSGYWVTAMTVTVVDGVMDTVLTHHSQQK